MENKVPDEDIYYCLCVDHALCGICLHILLWLVTKGIITPPPKWSAVHIDGPISKDRDGNYVATLLSDQQPSHHVRSHIVKDLQDPLVHHDTKLTLVPNKGIISLETDSIHKYVDKDNKYGHNKSALSGMRNQSSQKKRGRPSKKKKGIASQHDTLSEASSVSSDPDAAPAPGSTALGKWKETRKSELKGDKRTHCIDESQDESGQENAEDVGARTEGGIGRCVTVSTAQHRLGSVSKYVVIIVTPCMSRQVKVELMEIVLLTETDDTLKDMIEDYLTEDYNLLELITLLQDPFQDE
jgi:hypothetical protein